MVSMQRQSLRMSSLLAAALLLIVCEGNALPSSSEIARVRPSKWVVITTINHPTQTIRTLAQANGWKVVVVADKKTPTDWHLDNVEILDIEKQKTLEYRILPLLPYSHYGRKNLGYLWAIQHGATEVYETDDDNELKTAEPPSLSNAEYYVYNASAVVCNPYGFFGQPQIWPRGYPLEHIKGVAECSSFARQPARPLILQGLADMDPDVDAIYRLTQPLGIKFDSKSPSVVLPRGVMSPFNSQNTLFARDALWGLLIPVTTTFRVCDIWRGYWVQRLLWEVDGNLAFGPPTVNQVRNAHNLLQDMAEETDLYAKAGDLVKLLGSWRAAPAKKFPELIIDLAQYMADTGFWEQGDAELARAWVEDLKAIGYRFPKRQRRQASEAASAVATVARTPVAWNRYASIVLVINFNESYDGMMRTYELLREAYRPIFKTVVFTGGMRPTNFPEDELWVECNSGGGSMMQACLANVMQEVTAPPGGGHLILGDDVIISHCQLAALDASKVWFQRAVEPKRERLHKWVTAMAAKGHGSTWPFSHDSIDSMQKVFKLFMEGPLQNRFGHHIRQKLGDDLEQAHFGSDRSNALYIPAYLATDFQLGSAAFGHVNMIAEIAIPAILGIITKGPQDFQVIKLLYYWDDGQHASAHEPSKFLTKDGLHGRAFMLHPFKLSNVDAAKGFWQGSQCAVEHLLDNEWKGTEITLGVGVGKHGIRDQDEAHHFMNAYV